MRLLDLFCGAGGAAMGYHRAGFEVTGVDHEPQPRYPFAFIQTDALEYLAAHGDEYDVIHASPPCQRYTVLNNIKTIAQSTEAHYEDLIEPTRALLRASGRPYVIENVPRSPLLTTFSLCGCMFDDLLVYRKRIFESNVLILTPQHVPHHDNTPMAGAGISDKGYVSIVRGGIKNIPDGWTPREYKNMAMGIDWMTQTELSEAIPPAYTEYIGTQLMQILERR